MKISITINDFPLLLLDSMKQELNKYVDCEVVELGSDVKISCSADVVKCMEVVAVCDKYNFHMTDKDHESFNPLDAP